MGQGSLPRSDRQRRRANGLDSDDNRCRMYPSKVSPVTSECASFLNGAADVVCLSVANLAPAGWPVCFSYDYALHGTAQSSDWFGMQYSRQVALLFIRITIIRTGTRLDCIISENIA